ncbi:hypothetical protein JDV09_12325 [Mycobacterium sp. Y57]|uniref:hypothetical protein n=1 Tax=Mycolicibacterium xanthum TaxID=2796469 RepID=UPI001C85B997|nr:hypothetical protein [Mycolicibacterium xanthum]MBX7432887.1 hypothetical protein [Mycolicibacterium xanthum]
MTTAGRFHVTSVPSATVSIAGVAWPTYKVIALLVGLLVFGVVAVATMSAGPAVLAGTGVATLAWIALRVLPHRG